MLLYQKLNKKDIKAVIFDFDNTLVNENNWLVSRWEKTNKYVEIKYNYVNYSETFWKVCSNKGLTYPKLVNETLDLILKDYSSVNEIVNYFKCVIVDEKLNDGSVMCLVELKKKYMLGIITNGKQETHEDRIKMAELSEYFDVVIYAYNNPKPNKEPFMQCAKKLNIDYKNFIYVGDDYNRDYLPALEVGYFPILYDPNYENNALVNCNVIHHLASLVDILI